MPWRVNQRHALMAIHGIHQQEGCDAWVFCQEWADAPAFTNGQQAGTDSHVAMTLIAGVHGDKRYPHGDEASIRENVVWG